MLLLCLARVCAIVVQTPPRSFWMSTRAPSVAGDTVPLKRTVTLWRPRLTFFVSVLTWTAAPTTTIGLTTSGLAGICTWYCVVTGTERTGNAKLPSAAVTCGLPTGTKPLRVGVRRCRAA